MEQRQSWRETRIAKAAKCGRDRWERTLSRVPTETLLETSTSVEHVVTSTS